MAGALALALSWCADPSRAQGVSPPRWELLGLEDERINGLFFAPGPAADGSADTLYAHRYGLWRRPVNGLWSDDLHTPTGGADYATRTPEGYLLVGAPAGPTDVDRSTDGGRTWQRDVLETGIFVLFQSTLPALGGAVYACNLAVCYRSFDSGAKGSWEQGGLLGGESEALGEVEAAVQLPDGRLLAGLWNGVALSDDGGQTWTPSALWRPGALIVNAFTFDSIAGHPFGGVAYASAADFSAAERAAVHRSDDGGQTWAQVRAFGPGDFGVATPHWAVVAVDDRPGGALYVGIEQIIGGTAPGLGAVVASFDGGETWEAAADTALGWGGYAVTALVIGRDGRLYAATDRGVYRTAEAVPTAAEPGAPEPPGETGAVLEVHPNPARGGATVTLTLAAPAHAQLTVLDGRGRVVAVLADGPYAAGRHTAVLDAEGLGLPAGVYVVQAAVAPGQGPARVLAQPVTILR